MRALLTACLAVSCCGCSFIPGNNDFGCPYSQGVTCRSPRDVYSDTNPGGSAGTGTAQGGAGAVTAQPVQAADRWPVQPWMNLPHLDAPQPLRTPPVVMRIWVASWQDTRGDLQMPGDTYTEIEPRRWAVGEESDRGAQRLVPLDVKPVTTQQTQAAGAASTPNPSSR